MVPQDSASRPDESFAVPATHRREWDFTRDGVLRSVEDSLQRMGVDRIDPLMLHDAEQHFEDALGDGCPALAELRDQQVVGATGKGMYHPGKRNRLVNEADVDVVMLSGRCALLDHSGLDELRAECTDRGVSVLAASVFNSGLLATNLPLAGATFDYAPASSSALQRAHRLADVAEAHGVTLPQLAMAFPLRHPAVAGIIVGMRSETEVRRNVVASRMQIPEQVWDDL
ncbi:aldo/keto reductase [Streptomyces sp. NPDC056390]|uniref:aldo/keto reductase n=1 Tax=Streptomyces sp. NPDC056390 TaxID=3345806 RepID=UPI0035D68902